MVLWFKEEKQIRLKVEGGKKHFFHFVLFPWLSARASSFGLLKGLPSTLGPFVKRAKLCPLNAGLPARHLHAYWATDVTPPRKPIGPRDLKWV